MKQPDTYCLSLLIIVLRKPLRILKSKKWEKWERQQPLIIVEIHQPSNLTKYYTKKNDTTWELNNILLGSKTKFFCNHFNICRFCTFSFSINNQTIYYERMKYKKYNKKICKKHYCRFGIIFSLIPTKNKNLLEYSVFFFNFRPSLDGLWI